MWGHADGLRNETDQSVGDMANLKVGMGPGRVPFEFIHSVPYKSVDFSSTLTQKCTIALPVKTYFIKAPFINPRP